MLKSFLQTFQDIMFVERFSAVNGALQRIDARIKLCSFLLLILTAVFSKTIISLMVLLPALTLFSLISKIPLKFFFLRTTIFIPLFAAVIVSPLPFITPGVPLFIAELNGLLICVTLDGLYKAVQFIFKIWVCVASLTLLILTTRFSNIIHTLERFRIPSVFITMTALTYRFIFLFIHEAYRMVVAKEARTINKEGTLKTMKSTGHIISALFIRAYEKGERVYLAMKARGYSKDNFKINARMKSDRKDWIFLAATISICVFALLSEFLHLGSVS